MDSSSRPTVYNGTLRYKDGVTVELTKPLSLSYVDDQVYVKEWKASLTIKTTVRDALSDWFCYLYDLAVAEKPDKTNWLNMLSTINYQKFSVKIAPPMYEVATIIKGLQNNYFLRQDGKYYKIPDKFEHLFEPWESGTQLGVFIKRGLNKQIVEITKVEPYIEEAFTDAEWDEVWNSLKVL